MPGSLSALPNSGMHAHADSQQDRRCTLLGPKRCRVLRLGRQTSMLPLVSLDVLMQQPASTQLVPEHPDLVNGRSNCCLAASSSLPLLSHEGRAFHAGSGAMLSMLGADSRKKRATEATKLVEAAKRWEKVDGGLASARGRNGASAGATTAARVARRSGRQQLQSV